MQQGEPSSEENPETGAEDAQVPAETGDEWLLSYASRFTTSASRKAKWLKAWADGAGWTGACKAAGVAASVPSGWTKADPLFAAARLAAEQAIADRHEAALDGLAQGDQGTQVQLNAIALRLRGLKPARYRDSAQRLEVSGSISDEGSASRAVELLARFAAAARSQPALPDSPPALPEGTHGEA